MAHLTLAGLSEDGKRLLLVDDRGAEFTVDVDQALRRALRGEHARIGQLEIHMDASLRPRDIQARIRAGETPEAVAQAASTTVDKVMPYAAPVLAERAHIADRAQRASIRRTSGDGGARKLGDAVTSHLAGINVKTETIDWDAWRREDGRWTLTATYTSPGRSGNATFTFDAPGNYVTAEDDDARWLVGDHVEPPKPAAPRAPRASRRLSAVPAEDELPLGEDALEMVHEEEQPPGGEQSGPSEEQPGDLEDSPFLSRAFDRQNERDEQAEVDGASAVDDQAVHTPEPTPEPDPTPEPTPESEQPQPETKRGAKKRGRASVPSWDEIMFGGGGKD